MPSSSCQSLGPGGGGPSTTEGAAHAAARLPNHVYPLVLILEPLGRDGAPGAVFQTTYASLVRVVGNPPVAASPPPPPGYRVSTGWGVRVLKQTICTGGRTLVMKELYGTPAAPSAQSAGGGEEHEGTNGTECVVCLSAPRCVAALPCRHLSLCEDCSGEIQRQRRLPNPPLSSGLCPICRAPVQSLLSLRGGEGNVG